MDLDNLIQLFSSSGAKIDALWEFYVIVHIALFSGLFFYHKLNIHQFVGILVSYTSFSLINLRAKYYEYQFYAATLNDIKSEEEKLTVNIKDFFKAYSVDDRINVTYLIHIGAFIFLLYLIWSARNDSK